MKSNDSPIHLSLLGVVLFGLAIVMIVVNVFSNMGSYFGTLFVKTETPASFEFQSYDGLLKKYTHESRVDYKSLKGSKELEAALADLRRVSPEKLASEEDKICYWVNAYNLLSMKLICDKFPIESIKELGSDQGTKSFIVGGKAISAKEIDEEKIVPAIYGKNWLLLFAKCNGSVGYPDIADHPYRAATLADDLLAQQKKFVLRRDNWYYDDTINKLEVTEFYMWNRHYLEGVQVTPLMLLNNFLPDGRQIDAGTHVVYNLVCQQRVNQSKDWSANPTESSASSTGTDQPATGTGTATSTGAATDVRPATGALKDSGSGGGEDSSAKRKPESDIASDSKADKATKPSASVPETEPPAGTKTSEKVEKGAK
ncbi:MAG: DUF547 domain-containing protein [Candidatus Obscuribacterales bacterium]|nr:DUF547 domain-containing protein [Candidatus Obscuribacterales bacterium]